MSRRSLYLFLLAIVILLVFIVYLLVFNQTTSSKTPTSQQSTDNQTDSSGALPQSSSENDQPTQSQTNSQLTPTDVAKKFYTWYFSYPKDPLTSRAYKSSPLLTDSFKEIITSQVDSSSPNDPNYDDPVFCKVNKTRNFTVGQETYITNDKTNVMIQNTQDGRNIYKVVLVNSNGQWLISDIICVP